jgi:hypothetical protein
VSISAKSLTFVSPRVKFLVGVWGLPIVLVVVAFVAMPDPSQPKSAHPSATFTPGEIAIHEGRGRKKSDHWELLIHQPDGSIYYIRNPESEPIQQLHDRIPKDVPLQITYTLEADRNLLLAIERADGTGEPILSYESVMAEYAERRTLIFSVATIWLVLGNLLAWGLYRKKPEPHPDADS